jgi:hypothetical protein
MSDTRDEDRLGDCRLPALYELPVHFHMPVFSGRTCYLVKLTP